MPTYKLHYFPIRGVGEPIELMFKYAGTPLEIKSLPIEEWKEARHNYPRRRTPVLEVDGKTLCEMPVILKYLGDQFALGPEDPWEAIKAAELSNFYSEFYVGIRVFLATPFGKQTEWALGEFVKDQGRPFLEQLEKENLANGSGWMFSTLSYADFAAHNLVRALEFMFGVDLGPYPRVKAHLAKLQGLPQLKDYFETAGEKPWAFFQPCKDIEGEMRKKMFASLR